MRRARLCVVLLLALPCAAQAQDEPLEQAEAAYLEVDFEGAYEHALEALRAGGHRPDELVRIYRLLGISSSALGRGDEARDFFVRMLGLDRDAELDSSVPPRLRGPFLEARGVWAVRQGELGIEVGLDRAQGALHIELSDPTGMGERISVHARLEGEARYANQELAAGERVTVPIAGAADADRVEYYAELLDAHGNVLFAAGSAFDPRVVGRVQAGPAPAAAGRSIFEEPAFWIVAGLVVVAGAAIGTGVALEQQSHIGAQTSIVIGID